MVKSEVMFCFLAQVKLCKASEVCFHVSAYIVASPAATAEMFSPHICI